MNRYQKTILRDVRRPTYDRERKWVWALFGFFGCLFAVFFFAFFREGVQMYWGFARRMYGFSLTTRNETFKTVIYIYQHLLLFAAFACVVALFLVLAFMAYDMQQRNEIIRRLLAETPAPDNADASKKGGS